MLPLFYMENVLTGKKLCSVPFSHSCGYIGDSKAYNFIIEKSTKLFDDLGVDCLEIRSGINTNGFKDDNSFCTHVIELTPNHEEIWRKLSYNVKRNVRKSEKSGVSVQITQNLNNVRNFYELNCLTKRKIGVPCHPWKFFKIMFEIFNDKIFLYTSNYQEKVIGGGIVLFFKDTAFDAYAAADPAYLDLFPYYAYKWKCIMDSCINGYKYFDFGRSSYGNMGLIEFKKKWGTVERPLYYSYYPKNPKSLSQNRESLKYKIATKTIQRVPISLYKKFSNLVFGYFG